MHSGKRASPLEYIRSTPKRVNKTTTGSNGILEPLKEVRQKKSISAMLTAPVDQVERSINMTRHEMGRKNAASIWTQRHREWLDIYEMDAMKAYGNGTLRHTVTEAGGDLDMEVVDGSLDPSVAAWYLATAHGQSDTATEYFTKLCERESPVSLS